MSRRVNALARAIADGAVRSDIECFAKVVSVDGRDAYNTREPASHPKDSAEDRQRQLLVVTNAVRYIQARGDVFPWRMLFINEAVVLFKDKRA